MVKSLAPSVTAALLSVGSVVLALPGGGSHGGGGSSSSTNADPFFTQVNNETWVIGNGVWNMTQNYQYGTKLWYKGRDCVGDAWGHYVSYNGAASDLAWLSASVHKKGTYKGTAYLDVVFNAAEGDMHWVIFAGQHGSYQYFVNHALPTLGEFRTLWRLDNTTFTNGHIDVKDGELPPLEWYITTNKVQDETWLMPDGVVDPSGLPTDYRYITKYDWSAWLRDQTFYGVYGYPDGEGFGSWYINPGKDYYGGNQLKQELMVHRESATGDAVMLNMIHGTHFQASSSDSFPDGKTWGPWLWYLNDGSQSDASSVWDSEEKAWPYAWMKDNDADPEYLSRGIIKGVLRLSDGRPAAGANVFLGDNNPGKTALDMGTTYYYTTTASASGSFEFKDVRTGDYALQAWSNGGKIADVTTTFLQNDVSISTGKTTNLRTLSWEVSSKTKLFQVGDFDRKAIGFAYGGDPRQHALCTKCPADLTFVVGQSDPEEDWCFVQTYTGNWTISFTPSSKALKKGGDTATLLVSIAGYSVGSSSNIWLNGDTQIGSLVSGAEGLTNDQSVYRSCTAAGEWRLLDFDFDASLLQAGEENTITFEMYRETNWHGFMWDSIVLEV